MIIKVARTCGFCSGVKRAIKLALEENNKPVYFLGELIHNERVLNSFAEKGIKTVSIEEVFNLNEGTIIIRAHGISPKIYNALSRLNLKIIDATCPNVLKIHEIVKKAYALNMGIIIIGNKNHPEVIGVNGCADNNAIIVSDEKLPEFEKDKDYICVVQTTFREKIYNNIINKLKKQINSLVNYNTICYTTKVRQSEAESLSLECDTMFVIGSKNSSNTTKLYDICSNNCKNTYLIEDIVDINSVTNKNNIQKIGVTTGASTPKELVMEVILGMSSEVESVKIEDLAQNVAAVDTTATETENVEVKEDTEVKTAEVENTEAKDTEVESKKEVAEEAEDIAENKAEPKAKKKTEKKTKKVTEINTMEDVMNATVFGLREGKKVKCTVIKADETGVYVNFGGKKDGFIESDKTGIEDYKPEDFKEGDTFYAVVVENKTGSKECITLDKRAVDEILEVEKAIQDEVFDVKIDKAVKGGLLGKKGSYTIFIPASQVDLKRVEDEELEAFVGKTLAVSKLPDKDESDKKRKRIVASHKAVLWAEKKAAREKAEKEWKEKREKEEQEKKDIFLANIDRFEVNNVVPGIVKRFTNFGAFVNVYGFDCLAPKSELSWERDVEPSSLFEIGKEYEFVIIKVDPDNFKVSLSYKLLQEKPKSTTEIIAEKYHVGMIVKGKVQTLAPFGAFVSLEPRIDGLVHVSNISDKRINAPSDVLNVNDEIEAKIISIRDSRIALSIKDVNVPDTTANDERPSRVKRFEKTMSERKPRKSAANEMQVPKEEQKNLADYGAVENAKNTVLGDLLKGFEFKSDDE